MDIASGARNYLPSYLRTVSSPVDSFQYSARVLTIGREFAPEPDAVRAAGRAVGRAPQHLVEAEFGAEIDPAHFRIGRQGVGGSAVEDAPVVDDVGAIGDAEGLANVVVGD